MTSEGIDGNVGEAIKLTNLKYTFAFEYPLKANSGATNAIRSKMARTITNRLIVSSPSR